MNEVAFLVLLFLSVAMAIILLPVMNRHFTKIDIPRGSRFGNIDGLRGFLAIFVFFHHYYIFYFWRLSGEWVSPGVSFIEKLGVASVSLFFMITGFLFLNKISGGDIDWKKLFVSRFFRIMPLYLLVLLITVFYSFLIFEFHLHTSVPILIKDVVKWFLFIGDEINSYPDSRRITAGVTWTLKYEWVFYLCLPVLYFFLKNKLLIYALVMCSILLYFHNIHITPFFETKYIIFFMYGGVANFFYTKLGGNEKVKTFIESKLCSWVALILLMYLFFSSGSIFDFDISFVAFLFFMLVVLGNDLFGVLSLFSSKILGEISYSIYLLHGVVIYSLFFVLFDINMHVFFERWYFFLFMPVSTLVVVLVSLVSFSFIEKRFISLGRAISSGYFEKNKSIE
ncbi:acyltransferase family protein [Klebsiella michiganensis]|uniref:acyltransferase family protein n=1 Tax=Klebsiella michiganensis TaxID=1134687 RepID=UPI00255A842D|nr:acyltransferase [Klebsiella michiganensis]MDL4401652.1 acyltransferase [Klebsiella michiganensis]MDL4532713.1 acyltransferase [Klebsiella michiganensis]